MAVVLPQFARFIAYATMLSWVFISFAFIISVSVEEKSKAAGLSLIIWFLMVLVFDLAILALLVGAQDLIAPYALPYLMWLNPTDLFRLINLMATQTQAYSGVLHVAADANFSTSLLLIIMLCWIGVPLAIANTIFNRQGV